MKKLTLTIAALIGLSIGVQAQGLITLLVNNSSEGALNTSSSSVSAPSGWYTGAFTLYVWEATSNSTELADATAINALDANGSSAAAIAALTGDGFTDELIGANTSVGTNGTASTGNFSIGNNGGTVTIAGASGSDIVLALEVVTGGGLEGVIAFPQYSGSAPTTPANLNYVGGTGYADQNLLLSPVPEPASLALAGLGGLSMLLFRRRNK